MYVFVNCCVDFQMSEHVSMIIRVTDMCTGVVWVHIYDKIPNTYKHSLKVDSSL